MLRNFATGEYADTPPPPPNPCHPGPVQWCLDEEQSEYFEEDSTTMMQEYRPQEHGAVPPQGRYPLWHELPPGQRCSRGGLQKAVQKLADHGITLHCHPWHSIVAFQLNRRDEADLSQNARDHLLLRAMLHLTKLTGLSSVRSFQLGGRRQGPEGAHLVLALHQFGAPGVMGDTPTNISPDGLASDEWPERVHAYVRIHPRAFMEFHPDPLTWLLAFKEHGGAMWPTSS